MLCEGIQLVAMQSKKWTKKTNRMQLGYCLAILIILKISKEKQILFIILDFIIPLQHAFPEKI